MSKNETIEELELKIKELKEGVKKLKLDLGEVIIAYITTHEYTNAIDVAFRKLSREMKNE